MTKQLSREEIIEIISTVLPNAGLVASTPKYIQEWVIRITNALLTAGSIAPSPLPVIPGQGGEPTNTTVSKEEVPKKMTVEYIISMYLVDYQIRFQNGKWFKKILRNKKIIEVRADQELALALHSKIYGKERT